MTKNTAEMYFNWYINQEKISCIVKHTRSFSIAFETQKKLGETEQHTSYILYTCMYVSFFSFIGFD